MLPEYKDLDENDDDVFNEVSTLLLRILENVLKAPNNPRYRKLRLAHETISNKLLPAIGAMQCLFLFGFQESDTELILPSSVSIPRLKYYRDELIKFCANRAKKADVPKTKYPKPLILPKAPTSFLEEVTYYSKLVQQFEDNDLQSVAESKLPIEEFSKQLESAGEKTEFESEFGLIIVLLKWYKDEFFKWLDNPMCKNCNVSSTFQGYSTDPKELVDTTTVEIHGCPTCGARFVSPRHKKSAILLETRIGRCEEWANCFTLFCRVLGYDARFVVDKTDHVWTEVYSNVLKRWVHCDPSEGAIDTPLMYEKGWKKNLSYVIAFSKEEVQDVTWRYTSKPDEVRSRRRLCREDQLLKLILELSDKLQTSLSEERKKYLVERRLHECVEFFVPPQSDIEYGGRISGSLQWRLSRGECEKKSNRHIWKLNDIEKQHKKFLLRFSNSKNEYHRVESDEQISGWENGTYELESIFRKVERDWKMCYLCRSEGSSNGTVKWRFSFDNSGLVIDKVRLKFRTATFESGSIKIILCNDETCIPLNSDELCTDSFKGSRELSITATLSGGVGDHAWQHAQLFRQPNDDDDYSFEIEFNLCSSL